MHILTLSSILGDPQMGKVSHLLLFAIPHSFGTARFFTVGHLLPNGCAMLMSPNKDETAVHGCHCPGDMAVRMRKVHARQLGCLAAIWNVTAL